MLVFEGHFAFTETLKQFFSSLLKTCTMFSRFLRSIRIVIHLNLKMFSWIMFSLTLFIMQQVAQFSQFVNHHRIQVLFNKHLGVFMNVFIFLLFAICSSFSWFVSLYPKCFKSHFFIYTNYSKLIIKCNVSRKRLHSCKTNYFMFFES